MKDHEKRALEQRIGLQDTAIERERQRIAEAELKIENAERLKKHYQDQLDAAEKESKTEEK